MTNQKSFVLYDNYWNQLEFLTMEQRGELLTAIFEYRKFGECKTQLSQINQVVFSFIRDTLERDAESYKRRCEANRENGKRGGRPPKNKQISETQKPKKPDNDNDNGIDNENENDIDNGIDIGNGIENEGGFAPLPSPSAPPQDVSDLSVSDGLSETEKEDLISFTKQKAVGDDSPTVSDRAYARLISFALKPLPTPAALASSVSICISRRKSLCTRICTS